MENLDPPPQAPTCRGVELIHPTNFPQAVLHFRPCLYARCAHPFGQALGKPLFFVLVEGHDPAHEKGPGAGCGLRTGADAYDAMCFALFYEGNQLGFETLDDAAEGEEHVQSDFDVDQSCQATCLDLVVEVSHL